MMKSSIKALCLRRLWSGLLSVLLCVSSIGAPARAEGDTEGRALNIVTTIPPLYALTAKVMEGSGEPYLLMKDGDSPHHFSMRPKDAQRLLSADAVICAALEFEPYLKPLRSAMPERKHVLVEALKTPGLVLEPAADISHRHGQDVLEHGYVDMHFWLNPTNAIAFTQYIAEELSTLAPQHTALYAHNAEKQIERLRALDKELRTTLHPGTGALKARYATYHASLRYFESHYGIRGGRAVTRTPESGASVEEGERLHQDVTAGELPCLLHEPEFPPRLLHDVAARHKGKTRVITLDTLGTTYDATPDLYETMMRDIASALSQCVVTENGDD